MVPELFRLADDLPDDLDRPVLIQALSGFVDAGAGVRLAREHLRELLDTRPIATFDADDLLDYRSRRPTLTLEEDRWIEYDAPRLTLHAVRDLSGTAFLLLDGPEPDLRWERFIAAVTWLIAHFEVRLTVGVNAIPMAVPHTRPSGVTAHGTRADLVAGHQPWVQRVQVPASVGNLLEYRLGEAGRDAIGFAVHVPHYLAQAEYPAAAETLLHTIGAATGLDLPLAGLRAAAVKVREEVDEQVAQSAEALALVGSLEQQYDAFVRGQRGDNLLADTGPLPTAEELGAELERFLAEQANPGDQPG